MSDGERPVYEQRGLWYEELEVGALYRHAPGRTVSEADNILFSTLTMNPQALHLDEAWAAQQPFGQRLVNSLFTLSTLVGLSVAQLTQGTIVANLGFSDVVFRSRSSTATPSTRDRRGRKATLGKPSRTGVVTFEHTARNQHGEVVAVAKRATMVFTRPE